MSTTTAARNRLLAVTMSLGALFILVSQLLFVEGTDVHVTSTRAGLDTLAAASEHPARFAAYGLFVVLGLAALGAAFVGIASLVHERGGRLATIGAALGIFGAFSASIVNVVALLNVYSATRANASRESMAEFLAASQHDNPTNLVFGLGYFVGLTLAVVLTSIALYRSRVLPRWVPVCFGAGFLVGASAPSGLVAAAALLPFVASVLAIARRVSTSRVATPATPMPAAAAAPV